MDALLTLCGQCGCVADIGCDHGYFSAHMIARGLCERVIASDISESSLDKARALAEETGIAGKVSLRVGDGLTPVDAGEADVIVLAGMGARTIAGILERGKDKLRGAAVVIAPNKENHLARAWFSANGYAITRELVARVGRRFTVVSRAEPSDDARALTGPELDFGPCLLVDRTDHFADYLMWRQSVAERALSGALKGNREQDAQTLRKELARISAAMEGAK